MRGARDRFLARPSTYYDDVPERDRRDRRGHRRPAPARHPGRPRRRGLPPAGLHQADRRPADGVLRGHRAPRRPRLRRGQLQGPVRGDRARAGAPREPLMRPHAPPASGFGLRVLAELRRGNAVLSPLGLQLALATLRAGASGRRGRRLTRWSGTAARSGTFRPRSRRRSGSTQVLERGPGARPRPPPSSRRGRWPRLRRTRRGRDRQPLGRRAHARHGATILDRFDPASASCWPAPPTSKASGAIRSTRPTPRRRFTTSDGRASRCR